jgi:hypothetical protein
MTEELAIQGTTKSFREEVASWSEKRLRAEGVDRDIPGAETLDKTTLREAIVQDERDGLRDHTRVQPQVRPSRASER